MSVNRTIASMTEELVRERGLELVCHDRVPNGDGGVSHGTMRDSPQEHELKSEL